jgi:hypothetical protein
LSDPPASDLVNRGCIVTRVNDTRARTLIVTGVQRSGTSLVASILQRAGLFIGSDINDIVFEDAEIERALRQRDLPDLRRIIGERNAQHQQWGFKYPMLCQSLPADRLRLFDAPRLIVMVRDPVAMAVRRAVSEYREPMQAMRELLAEQAALMDFVAQIDCPALLLSYEKALAFPEHFLAALLNFTGLPVAAGLHRDLLGMIEPNRWRYVAFARSQYDGLIDGVSNGQLYGWCRRLMSAEPVMLDVLIDDRLVITLCADEFRQDLLEAGIGAGRHGFSVPLAALPARPDSSVRIRVAGHTLELGNSGRRLRDLGH